ncbi:GTPase HflX [Gardnerella vaginalis]|uniref:GTPase HflX n=1 Tax=Gardnerella vaginalis TaxID=2702 RepID=A0A2K1SUL7_GARVA|nr:GTPase HflX [Gardnerella vaginalis]PNS43219.1 GTPase HflX [Gardnerella vaginalis]
MLLSKTTKGASLVNNVDIDAISNSNSKHNDVLSGHSDVLLDTTLESEKHDEAWQERESRNALKRVAGLGELQDVTEVEYRKLRLERVVLVGVWSSARGTLSQAEESLRELAALAQTAGAVVCDGMLQQRYRPDAATYVGSGKARELAAVVAQHDADTIIVDDDLPPSQRRALEDATKVKVVDRTAVILDIFAQHATSREGKAQVELAQLQYMLPRLRGWGAALSRQAGGRAAGDAGIGSRGPGETKIEMDRRAIRNRISKLRNDIAHMAPARDVKRGSRRRQCVPTVAVVGYTNAGKSSIINRLTGSEELVENALFATLDTAVRRSKAQDGRNYTLVDTVGFVRRLPTQLVEAFKSTLEEVSQADVIMHVVDGSHPDPTSQIDAVNEVLGSINGVEEIPQLLVFNKSDCMSQPQRERLEKLYPDSLIVSAASGDGILRLRQRIEWLLPSPRVKVDVVLPYSAGSLLSQVRENGVVEKVDYEDRGVALIAYVNDSLASKLMSVAL